MPISQDAVAIGIVMISVIVVLSYLTDIFSAKLRIPSVLVLIGMGMLIRPLFAFTGVPQLQVDVVLPFLGTIGLILIVLEAALHLDLQRNALPTVKRAGAAALIVLVFTSAFGMVFLHYSTGGSWQQCLVNMIPLSVISSAMAIPTAHLLDPQRKEFIVYESTFSDILGILFFSVVVNGSGSVGKWVIGLSTSIIVTLFLSITLALGLVWLVTRLKHHVKFFLVLFILLLVYSLAKLVHLPALLAVFLFGLVMSNAHLFHRYAWITRHIDLRKVRVELRYTRIASGEMAFLVRTVFFVLFGYSLQWDMVLHRSVLVMALGVILANYLVRWLYFRFLDRKGQFPETWIGPRGLISVLLFYSIPQSMLIPQVSVGVVFLVVVVSAFIMALGVRKVR